MIHVGDKAITVTYDTCDPDAWNIYTVSMSPTPEVNGDHSAAINFTPEEGSQDEMLGGVQWSANGVTWYDVGSGVGFNFTSAGETYQLRVKGKDSTAKLAKCRYTVAASYAPAWAYLEGRIAPSYAVSTGACGNAIQLFDMACGPQQNSTVALVKLPSTSTGQFESTCYQAVRDAVMTDNVATCTITYHIPSAPGTPIIESLDFVKILNVCTQSGPTSDATTLVAAGIPYVLVTLLEGAIIETVTISTAVGGGTTCDANPTGISDANTQRSAAFAVVAVADCATVYQKANMMAPQDISFTDMWSQWNSNQTKVHTIEAGTCNHVEYPASGSGGGTGVVTHNGEGAFSGGGPTNWQWMSGTFTFSASFSNVNGSFTAEVSINKTCGVATFDLTVTVTAQASYAGCTLLNNPDVPQTIQEAAFGSNTAVVSQISINGCYATASDGGGGCSNPAIKICNVEMPPDSDIFVDIYGISCTAAGSISIMRIQGEDYV